METQRGAGIRLDSPHRSQERPHVHEAAPNESRTLKFLCGSCGLSLQVDASQAGVSGPCPACSAWITSPQPPAGNTPARHQRIPNPGAARPARRDGRGKGRISADTLVDHAHNEHRETTQTLKVIILFILVACACVAVTWFLTNRITGQ